MCKKCPCSCVQCKPRRRILVDNPDNKPVNLSVYDLDRGGKLLRCIEVNTTFNREGITGSVVLADDSIELCDVPKTGLSFKAEIIIREL